ncbi:outer mitochondrial membrane transport complex protein-domain-containing protein [Suillus subalutaceus]|uniref:outer mitochondrial membrane transport complex protein-domain-containing protein n=1 Tax=Suillus subalutaceus TaxID=48586 RepID=UPI001B867451|nr:outer mitochondrial membrane transport complex protein-domain-containing protein [Suillus subalutaceus]KAG1877983.1 outer mitochondrial membrane transport complex protein-domain-containing protein [Suillus subalutaceus]
MMSTAATQPTFCTLHIWPSRWNLPSIDPACIAAVFYLQLTIPGKFEVVECTNPDVSPSGKLPFLTHGHATVSSVPAIISFVSSLAKSTSSGARDLNASLSAPQRAKRTAWCSHVEANIGDLVAYSFYSLDDNFWKLTNPTMAFMLPIPQRYYVPGRIREMHRPRLEAAGLWTQAASETEKDSFGKRQKKDDPKDEYARAFERDKVSAQAKALFALYARLLNGQKFFFGERPTTLDVYLASHVLLLLDPPFPDQLMRSILEESYPTLVEHARNVQTEVSQIPRQYLVVSAQKQSLLSLIPRPLSGSPKTKSEMDEVDLRFRRMRWIWLALAFGGVASYAVQLWIKVIDVRANRRPRRVQRRGADQEHKAEVTEEEGEEEEDEDEGTQDGDEEGAQDGSE